MVKKYLMLAATMTMATCSMADIYKCVDEGGHVTYSNTQSKGCTRLVSSGSSEPAGNGGKSAKGATANPTPSNFPRVDGSTQRARDDDRRRILENELIAEQKSLDEARKALGEQAAVIEPGERNVAQRCQQVCNPGPGGSQVCNQVCTPVPSPGYNMAKVDERLQPYKDRVALHERNIEALKKEIANLK